jgi:recombination protein RecA
MVERKRATAPASEPSTPPRRRVYIPPAQEEEAYVPPSVSFTTSGNVLLDRVLGGGWAQARMCNIVGDKSSGKTLLAIEAMANFVPLYGPDNTKYAEAEAAFEEHYSSTVGMPQNIQRTNAVTTVQEWDDDLCEFLETRKPADKACMYVLDSLDALSDTAEMAQDDNEKGSYGAAKAKFLSEMFRKRIRLIGDRNCTVFVVSQLRDKLNVRFGETKSRSGGKALDFYASQVVWLAEKGKIKRTVLGADRIVGADVVARTKKNKVGPPFRQAEFSVYFNYGVDDEISMLDWIKEHKCEKLLALSEKDTRAAVLASRIARDRESLKQLHEDIASAVNHHWDRIEGLLQPPLSKYGK